MRNILLVNRHLLSKNADRKIMQPIRITSEKPCENKEVGPVKPVQMQIFKMKRLSLDTFRRAKNSREEAKEGQQSYITSFFSIRYSTSICNVHLEIYNSSINMFTH